jgi:hypothetical protein
MQMIKMRNFRNDKTKNEKGATSALPVSSET